MKIHVPRSDREYFWEPPPEGAANFWSFKSKPRCKIGDELLFMFDGRPVARARVSGIEPPGIPWREGESFNQWKVFWHQKSFQALEVPIGRGLSVIQEPAVKEPVKPQRVITASEVREFVYCPRAWKMKRRGVAPPPEAKEVKQQKVEKGDRHHLEHGEAVVQARRQQEKGRHLRAVGWALTIMGTLWCILSW